MTGLHAVRFAPEFPLPHRAFTPGEPPPHPIHMPGGDSPNLEKRAYWYGWDLLLRGFPWEAHEVWEPLWRMRTGPKKSWLQGLIRLAAALVKARSGNELGMSHHVSGALAHWRGVGSDQLPHGGMLLPPLEDWLDPGHRPSAQATWIAACSGLKPGAPGPNLLGGDCGIPEAVLKALMLAFQQETDSNTFL